MIALIFLGSEFRVIKLLMCWLCDIDFSFCVTSPIGGNDRTNLWIAAGEFIDMLPALQNILILFNCILCKNLESSYCAGKLVQIGVDSNSYSRNYSSVENGNLLRN